jgi:hypothetical protein
VCECVVGGGKRVRWFIRLMAITMMYLYHTVCVVDEHVTRRQWRSVEQRRMEASVAHWRTHACMAFLLLHTHSQLQLPPQQCHSLRNQVIGEAGGIAARARHGRQHHPAAAPSPGVVVVAFPMRPSNVNVVGVNAAQAAMASLRVRFPCKHCVTQASQAAH